MKFSKQKAGPPLPLPRALPHPRLTNFVFLHLATSDFVDDRRVTLTDIVERAVKKGKGPEIVSACNLCVLICLQLEAVDDVQEVLKDLKSIFVTMLNDASVAPAARCAVANAFATTCFLSNEESEVDAVMTNLEKIFLSNPNAPQISGVNAELSALTTAAVSAW